MGLRSEAGWRDAIGCGCGCAAQGSWCAALLMVPSLWIDVAVPRAPLFALIWLWLQWQLERMYDDRHGLHGL